MADSYLINGQKVSGFSRDAKDIDFDPTGTDLESTDAESAIKEVNGKFSECVTLSFTPSAVETYDNKAYPTGFSRNNCTIVSIMASDSGNWFPMSDNNVTMRLSTSYVGLYLLSGASAWVNHEFKVTLMKI